jgi:hypothetical protein
MPVNNPRTPLLTHHLLAHNILAHNSNTPHINGTAIDNTLLQWNLRRISTFRW